MFYLNYLKEVDIFHHSQVPKLIKKTQRKLVRNSLEDGDV